MPLSRLALLALPTLLGAMILAEPVLGGTASFESGVLTYRSAPGERDRIRAVLLSAELNVYGPLSAGPGCEFVDTDETQGVLSPFVRCPIGSGAPAPKVNFRLGDRNDHAGAESLGGFIAGGPGDDTIFGCGLLFGGAGRDSIHADGTDPLFPGGVGCRHVDDPARGFGGPGDDFLSALDEPGPVRLDGGPGEDFFYGSTGADLLLGGAGADRFISTGRRGDVIDPGPGTDWVDAEYNRGDDVVRARDGHADYVACGAGRDTVVLDRLDFYAGPREGSSGHNRSNRCEQVRRIGPARPVAVGATAYFNATPRLLDIPQNSLEIAFACPYDGPRTCAGTLIARTRKRVVLRTPFRAPGLGLWYDHYPIPRRALRSLTKWASLNVLAHDRHGRAAGQTMRGLGIVKVYVSEDQDEN